MTRTADAEASSEDRRSSDSLSETIGDVGKRHRRKIRKQSPGYRDRATSQRLEFELGQAFPPDDPVGHFVIAFSAAHNDINDTITAMFPPENPDDPAVTPAIRASLLRRALAEIWETHLLVVESVKIPAVSDFVDEISQLYPGDLDARELVAILRGTSGAASAPYRNVLRIARNATNHYPKPGTTDFRKALQQAIDLGEPGIIVSGQGMQSVRAEYADDVLVQMALGDMSEDALRHLSEAVGQTTVAIIHLAQTAMSVWLTKQGIELPMPP